MDENVAGRTTRITSISVVECYDATGSVAGTDTEQRLVSETAAGRAAGPHPRRSGLPS